MTIHKILVPLLAITILVPAPPAGALTITEQGRSAVTIALSRNSSPPEVHAARELSRFLKEVTGTEIPVAEAEAARGPRILVGGLAAKLADPDFSLDGLGDEGIVIRTVGNDLILAGAGSRGTLYAVYSFLEDQVGCRWWSPTVSTIPSRPTLEVAELNIRYAPPVEYREPFWFSAFEADWAVRNRCNGQRMPLDRARGDKRVIEGFVHTFYPLLPPGKYFKDHPDWYSEIDGQRRHERAQLCLTNDAMRAELVRNLKANLRNNPQATMASVSQNDWDGHCQCEKCLAIDTAEGSPAGSMIRFVNQVAEDIEGEFPNVAVSTLAYQYTQKPPAHARPRANVVVWLCSMYCSFNHPIKSHARNKQFRDDLEGWSKICDRLYIWDYTTNFRHYIFPHPNLRVLGLNIRLFVNNNVKGIFEQGAYQSWGSEMMELRAWVQARLLWNPTLDDAKLIDEFLDGYYGPAAPHIRAYLNVLHDAMQARMQPLGCFEEPDRAFMASATLMEAWGHLKRAEAAVPKEDKALRQRVETAEMPMLYAFLMKWHPRDPKWQKKPETEPWAPEMTPRAVYDRFMRIAADAKVTMISEHLKLDEINTRVMLPE